MEKIRADVLIVQKGLAKSREQAKRMIMAGDAIAAITFSDTFTLPFSNSFIINSSDIISLLIDSIITKHPILGNKIELL